MFLCKFPFGCARSDAPQLFRFNFFDEGVVVAESLPNVIIKAIFSSDESFIQYAFTESRKIADKLVVVFEVSRLTVQNVAHLSISIQGPVSIAWQRRATAPGAPAGVISGRPQVIEVGSGGLIRPGQPQPECGAAPRVWLLWGVQSQLPSGGPTRP